jgi:AraC family transcriptional regulator, regulatory protein of adaptative response / methylphosphotriester-DNA alkyltransferase methyltransferase
MSRAPMSQRRATRRRRRDLFEAAAEIIRFEYGDQLTLAGVAARLYTSPRQLQRAFSEAAETGFRDYLTQVRMEHARELLCESSYCVHEIARMVGYREPAQFGKAFRRAYGMSPSEGRGRGSGDGHDIVTPTERTSAVVGSASHVGQDRVHPGANGQGGFPHSRRSRP